jgi:hypothetical protein
MHTDSSLKVLEDATVAFGQGIRFFAEETCKHFKTVETDKEFAARTWAELRKEGKKTEGKPTASKPPSASKHAAMFSLETVKLHDMGDYVLQIKTFGTTDSYMMQIVHESLCTLLGNIYIILGRA